MRRFMYTALRLAVVAALAGCAGGTDRPKAREAAPPGGGVTIRIVEDARVQDGERGRTVDFDIYAPGGAGPYPILLFSHGLGASKSAARPLGRVWAAEGYVVLAPTHADSVTDLKLGDVPWSLGAWRDRVRDLTILLDRLDELSAEYPELAGADATRTGAAGHSFGAYTAMLLGGATIFKDGEARQLRDERVQAIVLLSGQGTGSLGLRKESYETLETPMMAFSGSLDYGRWGQDPQYRREPYRYAPAGGKYLVDIQGAHHLSYTGRMAEFEAVVKSWRERLPELDGPIGKRIREMREDRTADAGDGEKDGEDASLSDAEVFANVKRFTLLFWDAYLKGEDDALDTLRNSPGSAPAGVTVRAR